MEWMKANERPPFNSGGTQRRPVVNQLEIYTQPVLKGSYGPFPEKLSGLIGLKFPLIGRTYPENILSPWCKADTPLTNIT